MELGRILERLFIIAQCAKGNAVLFGSVAAICVITAVSLVAIRSRVEQTLRVPISTGLFYLHAAPLLIAPVLVSESIVRFADTRMPGSKDSPLLMALLALVFHSFLAVILLERVLDWPGRLKRCSAIKRNINGSKPLLQSGLALTILGPPLCTLFIIIWIFSESMISAPFFTGRETVISLAVEFTRSSLSVMTGLPLILVILFIVIGSLVVAWNCPIWMGRKLIRMSGRHERSSNSSRLSGSVLRLKQRSQYFSWAIALVSGVIHLLVATLAVLGLFAGWLGEGEASNNNTQLGQIAATFLTTAMACGVVGCLALLASTKFSVVERWLLKERPDLRGLEYLALAPPAFIGLLGLSLTYKGLHHIVFYGLMTLYSMGMLLFLSNTYGLSRSLGLIKNARSLRLKPLRVIRIGIFTRWGTLGVPWLVAFYFLWIEDGIQVNLVQSGSSFAQFVRGLKVSLPTPEAYGAALLSFVAWITVLVIVHTLTTRRFHLTLTRKDAKSSDSTSRVSLLFLALACMFFAVRATGDEPRQRVLNATTDKVVIRSHGVYTLVADDEATGRVVLPVLEVRTAGSVRIIIPNTLEELNIRELAFFLRGTRLEFQGARDTYLNTLNIDAVKTETAQHVLSAPTIAFERLNIRRLNVRGMRGENSLRPIVDIMFEERASAEQMSFAGLATPRLSINVQNRLGSDLVINDLRVGDMMVKGVFAEDEWHETYIDVELIGHSFYSNEPAVIRLVELCLGSGEIRIKAADRDIQDTEDTKRAGLNIFIEESAIAPAGSAFWLSIDQGKKSQIIVDQGRTVVIIDQLELAGTLGVNGRTLDLLRMDGVAPPDSKREGVIEIHSEAIGSLQVLDLAVREFSLCAGTAGKLASIGKLKYGNLQGVGRIELPEGLLQKLDPQFESPLERLRFYEDIQDVGVYCQGTTAVGLDARYFRKRADLKAVSPTIAEVMNILTGFGVRLRLPFLTLASLCLIILCLRLYMMAIVCRLRGRPFGGREAFSALPGRVQIPYQGVKETAGNRRNLLQLRYLMVAEYLVGIIVLLQITVCSIYFSQTTLQ